MALDPNALLNGFQTGAAIIDAQKRRTLDEAQFDHYKQLQQLHSDLAQQRIDADLQRTQAVKDAAEKRANAELFARLGESLQRGITNWRREGTARERVAAAARPKPVKPPLARVKTKLPDGSELERDLSPEEAAALAQPPPPNPLAEIETSLAQQDAASAKQRLIDARTGRKEAEGNAEQFNARDLVGWLPWVDSDEDVARAQKAKEQAALEELRSLVPAAPAKQPPAVSVQPPALSEQDREALKWAQANPDDPRAAAILQRFKGAK